MPEVIEKGSVGMTKPEATNDGKCPPPSDDIPEDSIPPVKSMSLSKIRMRGGQNSKADMGPSVSGY